MMEVLNGISWFLCAYSSIVFGFTIISILQSFTKVSLGLRKRYIETLLKIFDWSRPRCEKNSIVISHDEEHCDDDKDDSSSSVDESGGNRKLDLPVGSAFSRKEVPTKNLSTRCLLTRDGVTSFQDKLLAKAHGETRRIEFPLREIAKDTLDLFRWGMEAIVTDEFTESINVGELDSWNLMTRTDRGYSFVSVRLTIIYMFAFFVRYVILFPIRFMLFISALVFIFTASLTLSPFPEGRVKRELDIEMNSIFFKLLARSASLYVTYHNPENRAKPGGICVANHTSPIDMITLAYDNYYSLVGQRHTGILGFLESALGRVSQHIWFDRFEKKDRSLTLKRLRDHTVANKAPIMIFPEGVCVNNTAVLKFRKGCFEIGAPIYPAVIKYDRRFADPYWAEETMMEHIVNIFTSWALKVDVFYLPPMTKKEDETAIDFATRVKTAVATKGEFIGIEWDGTLKYLPVRPEVIAEVRQQLKIRMELVRPEEFELPTPDEVRAAADFAAAASVTSAASEQQSGGTFESSDPSTNNNMGSSEQAASIPVVKLNGATQGSEMGTEDANNVEKTVRFE